MEVELLHVGHGEGLEMIIAIDSTRAGPALGGCRWRPYGDLHEATREACALSRAMTRKASLARLRLGGGKAVVVGDPTSRTRAELLAFGRLVDELGGRYITAADMGTGEEEMAIIAEATPHVIGLPLRLGGCGDPSPFTAEGVRMAIEAALAAQGRALGAAHVAIQGVGHVGSVLVRELLERGAYVSAADPSPESLASLPEEVEVVPPDEILLTECDVLAPCGPSGVIDTKVASRTRCTIVCGAANNPLTDPSVARRLDDRGILYVPDFLANAGGLIHLAVALDGGDAVQTRQHLRVIPQNLEQVLERAKAEGIEPGAAAERAASANLA
jgi:glutamate dehydrogenase/leucine dehydrogenase